VTKVKQGLRDLAIAIGARDLDRLIQAYQMLEMLLPGTDIERIRQAEAALFDRLWGKSMSELVRSHPQEMRQFAREFRDVLYEMPFQVPGDMIFLGRCVSILSGMCTGLNPEFNIFEGLRPFAEGLLAEEGGDWLRTVIELLIEQTRALATLPARIDSTLGKIERGELLITARAAPDLQHQIQWLTGSINRLVSAVIFAALLLAGGLLYVSGEHLLGDIGLGLALVVLVWVLLGYRV